MSEEADGERHGDRPSRGAGGTSRGDEDATTSRPPSPLEAVLGIGTDLELRATLQHIVDTAAELVGARYGALGVLDPERGGLTELFTAGMSEADRQRIGRLPDGHTGLLGLLIEDPRPLRLDDLTADPRSAGVPPGHPRMRSFLGVPLQLETTVLGNLYLTEKRTGSFSEQDESLLRVLASQAALAIGNARLYGTARQRERWIEGAAAVTTALLTGENATDALITVAESARVLADAYAGVVLQPTEDGGMEIVATSTLGDPAGIVGTIIEPGSPVLVQLFGGEPVFIEDSSTDPRMTTHVRTRFGPSMMLPLQAGGKLIGTLALPRRRGGRPYRAVDRLLATQFASQAALALVLADAQHDREQLAVFEDRDRIARDLHDLVVQRLFATEMMLESTRRRATSTDLDELLGRAVDELDSTIQEVRTTIFALQQPPAEGPTSVRGMVLRETGGAAAVLGFRPSVRFTGPVDTLVGEPAGRSLLAELRGALAAAHRREGVTAIAVEVDAMAPLADGRTGVRLIVADDGPREDGGRGTTMTWEAPR
ncbi:GAF domain-containing protein [Streptomyces sp. 35G-GA-8]|uniref:GAF domain-containing sensor histidine kinase n=1 Tax=Streptomyces sp. 35G-GA-8 TaxID=2939434 RepID=UPI00201EE6F0|nr:GAF domain-containing protein [Streptomyces sp. 35G-GA-8]MCL7377220.1 GAF domain-containing protein [Streptomyces sp. 35G-GA-8]